MKTLTIIAAFALVSATQAMAGSGAQSSPKFSQPVTPKAAENHVVSYNIVDSKVVEGVKFENLRPTKSVSQQPAKMIFKALPTRS